MPQVELVSRAWLPVPPATVRDRLCGPGFVGALWPDLTVTVTADRGVEGVRWAVTGALVGSAEIWLQAYAEGVIVHLHLRADPTARGSAVAAVTVPPRRAAALTARRARQARRLLWSVSDEAEWSVSDEAEWSVSDEAEWSVSDELDDRDG